MQKKCKKCGEIKELNNENFARKNSVKSGFESQCKDCKRQSDQERYKRNHEKIKKQKAEYYRKKKDARLAEFQGKR